MRAVRNFFSLWFLSRAARQGYKSVRADSVGESLKHAGIAWGEVEIAKRLAQEKKTKKKDKGADPLEILFLLLIWVTIILIVLFVKYLGPVISYAGAVMVVLFVIGVIIYLIVSPTKRHNKEQNKKLKHPVYMVRWRDYALGITLGEVHPSLKIVVITSTPRLGLKAGDTITKINSRRIHCLSDILTALFHTGQKTVAIMREGEKKTVQFEVG